MSRKDVWIFLGVALIGGCLQCHWARSADPQPNNGNFKKPLPADKDSTPPWCLIPLDKASIVVLDGDTLRATINMPWGVSLRQRKIRLDYDAFESTYQRQTVKITPEEIAKGKEAKAALEHLLKFAEVAYVQPTKEEFAGYDRLSASLWIKIKTEPRLLDVRNWMITMGYHRPLEP